MAKNKNPVVALIPSACPRCGCTERESVRIIRERRIAGKAPNGQPRTHIVWRRVRCRACRRYYIEQEHQNRTAAAGEKKEYKNPATFPESEAPNP